MISESKFDLRFRMQFFGISWMLGALTDVEALRLLDGMRSALHDGRRATGLISGYKLIVETMLYRQIELIVFFPEILDLQADEALQVWWSNADQKSARRLKGLASGDAADSVFVANHMNDMLLRMVRAGNRWDRFVDASTDVRSCAATLISLTEDCNVVVLREEADGSVPEIRRVLRARGAECLHDYLFDRGDVTLTAAWDYAHAGIDEWRKPRTPVDDWMSEVETSKDAVSTVADRRRSADASMVAGFNAAIAIASGATMVERAIAESVGAARLEEDLFGDLRKYFVTGSWPSLRYGMAFDGELPENAVRSLMSFEKSSPDQRERLKNLLGDSAFLTGGASSNPELHFEALVLGLAAFPDEQPVKILRIAHKAEPINRPPPFDQAPPVSNPHPPISLAVRVGSDWHVFFRLDAVGRMKSSVWAALEALGGRVDVEEIEDVETGFLLGICDRAFQYVARQWKSQSDLNSDLRGSIPELLAGLLLVRSGFFPTRINVRLQSTGELDAVGYVESGGIGECRVVEVKKQSTDQNQLRWEIERFQEKIVSLRNDSSAVANELETTGPIDRFTGIFVSMARLGDLDDEILDEHDSFVAFRQTPDPKPAFKEFLEKLEGVEFWDYDRFTRELREADMPELPVRLLEEASFVWMFDVDESPTGFDGWDGLANAVERDDWQWQGSAGGVKDTFERGLREDRTDDGAP